VNPQSRALKSAVFKPADETRAIPTTPWIRPLYQARNSARSGSPNPVPLNRNTVTRRRQLDVSKVDHLGAPNRPLEITPFGFPQNRKFGGQRETAFELCLPE
jgi:hypothetical protein